VAEKSLGTVRYGASDSEAAALSFRRSLFAVQDVRRGEALSNENVRSIRPGQGIAPKHLGDILGRTAARDIPRGTPLEWSMIG
jgi:sialic acid synthase SpsE